MNQADCYWSFIQFYFFKAFFIFSNYNTLDNKPKIIARELHIDHWHQTTFLCVVSSDDNGRLDWYSVLNWTSTSPAAAACDSLWKAFFWCKSFSYWSNPSQWDHFSSLLIELQARIVCLFTFLQLCYNIIWIGLIR